MFNDPTLETFLKTSHTIDNEQAVWVEWNLNQSENIKRVGNYRYRPGTSDAYYGTIKSIYQDVDPIISETGFGYYTGATDSDIVINAGFDDSDNPAYFIAPKKKMNLLYSLDDCFKQNRPRSGINKLLYLGIVGKDSGGQYVDSINTFREIKSALITDAQSIDGSILYTATNNFIIGDLVKITGTSPSSYDYLTPQAITGADENGFSISGTNASEYISGGLAQMGYLSTSNIARRPRYYMASRYDDFKYWTSYRTQAKEQVDETTLLIKNVTEEFGIALNNSTGTSSPSYYIYDTAPFVVYNEQVPANRITIKMQTNVGEINNGPYRMGASTLLSDPFYGEQNKTVPKRWAIQTLDIDNNWTEVISFSEDSLRNDGSPIVGTDGQVELDYGLIIPELYKNNFTFVEELYSLSLLPDLAPYGYAYLYKESSTDKGELYVSDGGSWIHDPAQYAWSIAELDITKNTKVIKKLSNPDYYIQDEVTIFREFQFISGIRIVVDTMNRINSTFDLIEMSPRLVSDITKKVISFSVTKTLSDLGTYSMPTGNLLASTGNISIFDEDLSFNENNLFDLETNQGSIISQYSNTKIKFLFYDIIKNINGYDYYIPVKTLFSERIPQVSDSAAVISMDLRDLFYLLESKKSPELLLTNVSLSYAITVLLDNIGFSNYVFKRTEEDEELIIPYFFVGPDQNIAETLQQLAVSSQTAMFFDEFNDLVIMSKNYLLPSAEARPTDLTLYGQEELIEGEVLLPNIMNISSQEKKVYNGGEINYTTRYIQKSIGSISQAPYIQDYKTFIYKPVLLWEVAGQENTTTVNESAGQQSGYSLSAMPLRTDLSGDIPAIVNGQIVNNYMDFGESIFWMVNYNGYFYSGGEVIKYDSVEYSVAGVGNVWISNNQEYQNYFSKLKFNGKMYPTGRVRIYVNAQNNIINEHGRGQFGTTIVEHKAGLSDSPWTDDIQVRGSIQNAKEYLFNTNTIISYPNNLGIEKAGDTKIINGVPYTSESYAIKSTRNGIIKNFMANTNITENAVNYYKTAFSGSVQTSALIFNGPTLPIEIDPVDFITYAYKECDKPYKHFGTRMRIVGKIESGTNKVQSPIGSFDLFSSSGTVSGDPTQQVSITGGSGGLAFGLNKDTNVGYYFEIAALSQNNFSSYVNNSNVDSYTILKSPVVSSTSDTVTVTLNRQHDFEIGTIVVVSGLVDDDKKSNDNTRLNGEFVVTEISTNRKQFKYKITSAPNATITAVSRIGSGSNWVVTYTANNSFVAGQIVNISGLLPVAYNMTGAVISSSTETSFNVAVSSDFGALSDQSGTATYVPLTTLSSNGGTTTKSLSSDTIISNVFFYKVQSGSNTADIISKQKTGSTLILNTLRDHKLVVGEVIVVSGVGGEFDGSHQITAIGSKSIQYTSTSSGTIAVTDLDPLGLATSVNKVAIPKILWRGFAEIIADDGKFTTQSRLTTAGGTTVYDLSAEYIDIGTSRQFYLYLNNKQVAVVTDESPLPQYNNLALFVRGSSRAMFENVFALSDDLATNTARALQLPISKIFGDSLITESEAIKKFAISGIVQNTYLSGISSESPPAYSLYYEEFGTIMREAAYFNIRYDRAYPALYAKLAETMNRVRGYTLSGFIAGSYGAEFLIFNAIDKNLLLDDTSGNYLRILGIAFTQNTTHSLKVDDFFKKNSNFAEGMYNGTSNAGQYQQMYTDIQNSRNKYGRNDFTIDTQYVQTDAAAESMMDWIIKKVISPRKTVGVTVFGTPHLQLGDIVNLNYKSSGIDIVTPPTTRFVVYNIEYQKSSGSVSTTIHLAEV